MRKVITLMGLEDWVGSCLNILEPEKQQNIASTPTLGNIMGKSSYIIYPKSAFIPDKGTHNFSNEGLCIRGLSRGLGTKNEPPTSINTPTCGIVI